MSNTIMLGREREEMGSPKIQCYSLTTGKQPQKQQENGAWILLVTKGINRQRKAVIEGQMSPWNVFFSSVHQISFSNLRNADLSSQDQEPSAPLARSRGP